MRLTAVTVLSAPVTAPAKVTPVRVGAVPNTNAPDPVSSVTAVARLAEEGVPHHVAIPVPKLVIPVPPLATGRVPVICEVRSTPDKVPPKVRVPVVVIVPPVRVIPLTVPVVAIEVTVPLSESAAEVQAPAPSLF